MTQHVKLTVHCGACTDGHILGEYIDTVDDKYPFYCEVYGDILSGKHPWHITTEIVDGEAP